MKRTVSLLVMTLGLSLALNLFFWLTMPDAMDPPAADGDADGTAIAEPSTTAGDGDHGEDEDQTGCWVQLAECRGELAEESADALALFTNRDRPSGDQSAGEDSGEDDATASIASAVTRAAAAGAEMQEEVLCAVALEHLRDNWEERREQTVEDLLRSLTDDTERREMWERSIRRAQLAVEAPAGERAAFEDDFRTLWDERVDAIEQALATTPPDARGAFGALKSLFADQDAMVEGRFGGEARTRLRLAQAERRTTVLALFAALAERPWDDTITW